MGRAFSGATDRIDFGSAASLDDVNVLTYAAWIYPTNVAVTRVMFSKGGSAGKRFRLFGGTSSGSMQFTVAQASVNGSAQTPAATLVANTWQFVACTYDALLNPKIYRMALGGAMTDVSGTPTQGTGGTSSDAAQSMLVGGDASNPFPGTMAEVCILADALNPARLTSLAYGIMPQSLRLYAPLYGVASPEPDYSGNRNNGTLTGSAAGAFPPIRSRFAGVGSWAPDRTISGGGGPTPTRGRASLLGVGM